MAKRLRKGEFWLCRNTASAAGYYKCFPANATPTLKRGESYWRARRGVVFFITASAWHRNAPKSLHLPPGGGPIRIRVEAVK